MLRPVLHHDWIGVPVTQLVTIDLDQYGAATVFLTKDAKVIAKTADLTTIYTQDGGLIPVSTSETGFNLVSNGSAEIDTDGDGVPDDYTVTEEDSSTNVRVSSDQVHGAWCFKSTDGGNGGGTWLHTPYIEVSENTPFGHNYELKCSHVDVRNVIDLLWYDKDKNQLAGGSAKTTLLDDAATNPIVWAKSTGMVLPPATAVYCRPQFALCHSSAASAGKWSQLDNLELFNIPSPLSKGADVASANDQDIPTDGNFRDVTGNTTRNGLETPLTGLTRFIEKFEGTPTLKHNTAPSAGYSKLWIPGGIDYVAVANDLIEWIYDADADYWRLNNIVQNSIPLASQHGGEYIKLSETQAANTQGGTFTSGAWRTRTLNTEDSDTGSHSSLSSNQFTLDAGTYLIRAEAPAYNCDVHKTKLYNITDTADEIIGSSNTSANGTFVLNHSKVVGLFTIAASKVFEIQHQCSTTHATSGLGIATNMVVSEIYTVVELWKVK